jgi:hypothetical protein
LGAGRLASIFRVLIPIALPSIWNGMRLAFDRNLGVTLSVAWSVGSIAAAADAEDLLSRGRPGALALIAGAALLIALDPHGADPRGPCRADRGRAPRSASAWALATSPSCWWQGSVGWSERKALRPRCSAARSPDDRRGIGGRSSI